MMRAMFKMYAFIDLCTYENGGEHELLQLGRLSINKCLQSRPFKDSIQRPPLLSSMIRYFCCNRLNSLHGREKVI